MMLVSMLRTLEALLRILEFILKLWEALRGQKALSKQENGVMRFVFLKSPSGLLPCVEWVERNQEWK